MPSSWLPPRSVSLPRCLLEAAVGVLPVLGLGVLLQLAFGGAFLPLRAALTVLEWLWLAAWPAWRLRPPPPGPWWLRIPYGAARLLVTAIAVVAVAVSATALEWAATSRAVSGLQAVAVVAVLLIIFRLFFAAAIALSRPVRRRLRWQLMASHAGVIILTIVSLTAVGSLVGVALGLQGVQPDAPVMAQSVADQLTVAHTVAPFNRRRVEQVLDQIVSRRLVVRGEPVLSSIIPRYPVPDPIILESPDGQLLAGTPGAAVELRQDPDQSPVLAQLRQLAVTGKAAALPPVGRLRAEPLVFAAAPIRAHGKVVAVVMLQANDIHASPTQFFQGTLTLFGVATIGLILVSSLPLLALSFLFSYFLARGLTRRLEAVSHVASEIAAGNLAERAPVSSRNEVGRLAANINRMAAHLETTISQLERARSRAEEALRLRQQLVANVSHELRTPLAIVRAHLETLTIRQAVMVAGARANGQEEVVVPVKTLAALEAEIERLESLVEDLFTLSRTQSDALQVHCQPLDVATVVDEVATHMRPLAQREGAISVTVEAAPGLPRALADPERLRQILGNLVRNAVRHTPEGGIIALSTAAEKHWVVVSVADTGEGIAPEHLPHLFERFYRVDEARARDSGGAGLGLAIVRELVELMGGHVTVQSTPGEGTCFRVYVATAD